MLCRNLVRTLLITSLALFIPGPAFAQYEGGVPTAGGTSTGTGTYSSGGYSSSTGIAIGAGAAAGAAILYLALRKASVVGCIAPSSDGLKLMSEKDKNTYALVTTGQNLTTGERVELKGKKVKDHSGRRSFHVQKVARNFGPCTTESAVSAQQ